MTYERDGRIARITLDRPERGNGITLAMPRELAACVERANLDPEVHVIALAGNGTGFCGGYDLVARPRADGAAIAESRRADGLATRPGGRRRQPRSRTRNWDPVTDFQMMSRNVRGFMSLFHSEKPVVCKVHGYCVAGGTDMALCSDLLVVAEDAKIGYPPARVWGVPTTALWAHKLGPTRAKRLLLTGDSITGARGGRVGAGDRLGARGRARRRVRVAARAGRAAADQPARDAQAAGQPGALRPGPARDPGCWARSSTGSRATPRRATTSSAAPPRAGSRRRSASATSRSATSASRAAGSPAREGPGHQLAHAVRPRHDPPAGRGRARGLAADDYARSRRAATRVSWPATRRPSPRKRHGGVHRRASSGSRRGGIEVIVPAFEEAFYLSALRGAARARSTVVRRRFDALARLHDKATFQRLVDGARACRCPRRVVAQPDEELRAAIERFRSTSRARRSRAAASTCSPTPGPLAGHVVDRRRPAHGARRPGSSRSSWTGRRSAPTAPSTTAR